MTYPTYQVPSAAGVTWASGHGTLQQLPGNHLCSREDAEIIWRVTGGTLVNAALEPSTGQRFEGLDPASPFQPWWVTGPNATGFCGPAVAIMWGPNSINGGGIGNPGHWVTGPNTYWVPTPPAPPPPPPLVPPNPADAAAFAALQGATSAAAMQTQVAETYRLVRLLANQAGIP